MLILFFCSVAWQILMKIDVSTIISKERLLHSDHFF